MPSFYKLVNSSCGPSQRLSELWSQSVLIDKRAVANRVTGTEKALRLLKAVTSLQDQVATLKDRVKFWTAR